MGYSVGQICSWIQGRLANQEALRTRVEEIQVSRPAPLSASGPGDVAYFFSRVFQSELPTANPGILITGEDFVAPLAAAGLPLWSRTAVVACADPYGAMAILSEKFARDLSSVAHIGDEPLGGSEIHPSAVVHSTARLGSGVKVGAGVVVEARAIIGAGTTLYPGCYVGPDCQIGEHCVFFPNVVIYEWTVIGSRVRIHANSTLGSDGFGYAPKMEKTPAGLKPGAHRKIYHLGRVVIEDEVEIGANVSIDRGTIADTWVGKGAKLDNQVHLGHNSRVAEGGIVCGGTALAGNASVGRFAYVGGLTGITNHVHVGDGAKVAAMSLVTKDVLEGGTAVGNPQRDQRDHFRVQAWLNRAASRKSRAPGEGK